jgi:hypothetical protein
LPVSEGLSGAGDRIHQSGGAWQPTAANSNSTVHKDLRSIQEVRFFLLKRNSPAISPSKNA